MRGGLYLAPGFIDAHCHDDLICLREPERVEKIAQGVTTLVVGNCSFSLYPTAAGSAGNLRKHFSTLLGDVSADEVFEDFAGYRDAIHGRGLALNLVSLVGHAALRLAVIGHERRAATDAECNADAGAAGAPATRRRGGPVAGPGLSAQRLCRPRMSFWRWPGPCRNTANCWRPISADMKAIFWIRWTSSSPC